MKLVVNARPAWGRLARANPGADRHHHETAKNLATSSTPSPAHDGTVTMFVPIPAGRFPAAATPGKTMSGRCMR
ncbi:MAG: hypothetical protein IPL75_16080 [Acidobacteria bacterium]|nr:hypothetical protein [Acidobacteriota bacterium]